MASSNHNPILLETRSPESWLYVQHLGDMGESLGPSHSLPFAWFQHHPSAGGPGRQASSRLMGLLLPRIPYGSTIQRLAVLRGADVTFLADISSLVGILSLAIARSLGVRSGAWGLTKPSPLQSLLTRIMSSRQLRRFHRFPSAVSAESGAEPGRERCIEVRVLQESSGRHYDACIALDFTSRASVSTAMTACQAVFAPAQTRTDHEAGWTPRVALVGLHQVPFPWQEDVFLALDRIGLSDEVDVYFGPSEMRAGDSVGSLLVVGSRRLQPIANLLVARLYACGEIRWLEH